MKKILKCLLLCLICLSICGTQVKAAESINCECRTISVSGKYSDTISNNSKKKIIRTYKDLKELKKYIKRNYNNPNKYLNKLKKYKKAYFKKKSLVFVTVNVDMNSKAYKFMSVNKKKETLYLNVQRKSLLKEGQSTTCEIVYGARTYILEMKKSKVKNIKKLAVIYSDTKK